MANILYLLWWEGSKESGLIENVVYRQIEEISAATEDNLFFLSAGPFWKRDLFSFLENSLLGKVLLKNRSNRWSDIGELSHRFSQHRIKSCFRQTFLKPRTLYLKWYQLFLFTASQTCYLARLAKKENIDIMHCRSYFPAWLALVTRSVFRLSYRIMFDTRGLLPDEAVSTHVFSSTSISYKIWRAVETKLLRSVDLVVNVSETLTEHHRKIRPEKPMKTIYAPVDLSPFNSPPLPLENLPLNQYTLVYLGSISNTSWHSPEYLARSYLLFKDHFKMTSLLVITSSDHCILRSLLRNHGLSDTEMCFVSAKSLSLVASYLKLADCACLPFRKIRNKHDKAIAQTMISTKFTEYLAAGLPVLCNKSIGGASSLIEEFQIGTVVDLDDKFFYTSQLRWINKKGNPEFTTAIDHLKRLFSINSIAKKYIDAYSDFSNLL